MKVGEKVLLFFIEKTNIYFQLTTISNLVKLGGKFNRILMNFMERISRLLLKSDLDKFIDKCLINNIFSACSVAYLKMHAEKKESECLYYGNTGAEKSAMEVDGSTFFDLASLTKPLVTSLSIMVLFEEGRVALDDTLAKFFKRNIPEKRDITLYHLLTHSSGFPAHKEYYKRLITIPEKERKKKVIDWILDEKLSSTPGASALYSDLGFMLLGEIVERVSGENLDVFWKKRITVPLKLENDLFFTKTRETDSRGYAITGRCVWTHSELSGRVHDDNCRALGGVAGHAGLFGSASGVLRLCEALLSTFCGRQDSFVIKDRTLEIFFTKKRNSSWALGFDTPSGLQSSSGDYFSNKSIGHLGFTGTSFWMDLNEGVCIVLLTNRVACGEELENIKAVRPVIHDIIKKKLTKKG